jgi:large subunit ribosomal protein L13e
MFRPEVRKPREKKFTRKGRGFSLGEIKDAQITVQHMKLHRLPVDWLRSSVHSENVELLKKHFSVKASKAKKPKSKK